MSDRFGPRGVFSILIPLQNANMQPEYELMRPPGISNQIYRFDLSDHSRVAEAVLQSVPGSLLCWPDLIICGNSIEMQNWSLERQQIYRGQLEEKAQGTPIITATDACPAALHSINAKRIAILSPMSEVQSKSAQAYYESLGFEVPYTTWLKVKKSEEIIHITVEQILAAFQEIDHDDVDTFLHLGGALGIVGMIDELEAKLGRPVVSVNAATYWYSLRQHGIQDVLQGFGQLLKKTKTRSL
ncbi:MAG: hypothetical protein HQM13_01775 [SAR324 cluster bacterium]|nr:hypothetical protein [SAR324 cluster bacterium]